MDVNEPPRRTTQVTTGEEREALAANEDDMSRNKEEGMIERGKQSVLKHIWSKRQFNCAKSSGGYFQIALELCFYNNWS